MQNACNVLFQHGHVMIFDVNSCLPCTATSLSFFTLHRRLIEPYLLRKTPNQKTNKKNQLFKSHSFTSNFIPLTILNGSWVFHFLLICIFLGCVLLNSCCFLAEGGGGWFPWRWWWLCSDVDTSNIPIAFVISTIYSIWSS